LYILPFIIIFLLVIYIMPRKTRRQYRKKNKRGGMSHSKITSALNESARGIRNTRDNVTRKARGFLSGFKLSNIFGSKKNPPPESNSSNEMSPTQGEPTQAEPTQAKPAAAGPAAGTPAPAPPAQGLAQPQPTGGKRKSRRFRKKKGGKVTLQGGRRRRSRKSKSRRRRR
jgi:hypothetical protein